MYCLDASVIINAARANEPNFFQSGTFLNKIREKELKIFLPEIIIPEITSGLFRATKNSKIAYELALSLRSVPNFSFVSIDNLELITLDKEQLEKGKKLIKVNRP